MIEFYPQIRDVHILAVTLSGCLFAVRGLAVLMGMRWPLWGPVRYLSWTIDTVLLTAALMLLTILPWAMFANGWLLVKIVLIVVYVVLGVMAMRPQRNRRSRAICYVLALLTFVAIYVTARTHNPLGALAWITG